ncbi:aquaporin Z [uncultured Amnibacterium sp.]|uniref:aquaporin Z n=1 Tax=uncultured Amnibacterium sp. TaxID=1631851 RepID=UPI0035CC7E52
MADRTGAPRGRPAGARAGAARSGRPAATATAAETGHDRQDGIWIKLAAETFGTFVLVLGGCGSALIASDFERDGTQLGIGFLGVALAFGLTVLIMAVAVGGVSGGHFNPAVTVGLAVARRTPWRDVPGYIAAQVVGAVLASTALFVIASGRSGFDARDSGFTSNGYGSRSPGGYDLGAVALTEVLLTAIFLAVIIAATGDDAPKVLAPVAIGLTLTLIHLVAIPVDNASVNPARSLGAALFAGTAALGQLWVFLVAPVAGAAVAGLLFRAVTGLRPGLRGRGYVS